MLADCDERCDVLTAIDNSTISADWASSSTLHHWINNTKYDFAGESGLDSSRHEEQDASANETQNAEVVADTSTGAKVEDTGTPGSEEQTEAQVGEEKSETAIVPNDSAGVDSNPPDSIANNDENTKSGENHDENLKDPVPQESLASQQNDTRPESAKNAETEKNDSDSTNPDNNTKSTENQPDIPPVTATESVDEGKKEQVTAPDA